MRLLPWDEVVALGCGCCLGMWLLPWDEVVALVIHYMHSLVNPCTAYSCSEISENCNSFWRKVHPFTGK